MPRFRLRAKFLLWRLLIAAALSFGGIITVRYSLARYTEQLIASDLAQAIISLNTFQGRLDALQTRTATILAELPEIRRLLARAERAREPATPELVALAGTGVFVLADGARKVVALRASGGDFDLGSAQKLVADSFHQTDSQFWWNYAGRLYRVHRQFVRVDSFGQPRSGGILLLGEAMDKRLATEWGNVASCDVAFFSGNSLVASSLSDSRQAELSNQLNPLPLDGAPPSATIYLDKVPFRAAFHRVSQGPAAVELVVLMSYAQALGMEKGLTRLVIALGLVAALIGGALVLMMSDTFTRPLGSLVAAVQALEKGDFDFPVEVRSGDELAEVSEAFKQMRNSLKNTQERLLQSERLATIGQMASSISHDLRHPLTAIVANAEFLSEDQPNAEQRSALYQEIRAGVDQMNDLIESLLEFSKGRESPRLIYGYLADAAERAIRAVHSRPEFQTVSINFSSAGKIEGWFDSSKVERALGNLLINACEAVAPSRGRIELSLRETQEGAEIRVADNGPGIPQAVREKLFQPFASYGKPNGTGLGLAVAKKMCRDHGGDTVLESTSSHGTVFKLILPLGSSREPFSR